jgi:hypothetical protein
MGLYDIVGDAERETTGRTVPGMRKGEEIRNTEGVARTLFAAAVPAQIAVGGSAQFQIQLQVPMRIEQLVIESLEGGPTSRGLVTQISVGPQNQIVSNGGKISTRTFAANSRSNLFRGNTAVAGVAVLIDIENPAGSSGIAETFVVSIKGTAILLGG